MTNRNQWQACIGRLADFLESREKAMAICASFPGFNAHTPREWELMYDFCFRGTDANFTPPLWASVYLGEKALLNRTSLEIIRFYHRWGYAPQWMEGNPPDYLGEQLRFLEYLLGAESADRSARAVAARDFLDNYLLEGLKALSQSLADYPDVYPDIPALFRDALRELSFHEISEEDLGGAGFALKDPIPDEEEHIIASGGLNNCGGICVIRPHVQENCVVQIESDCNPSHAPQIRACVRGRGYRKTYLNPDRLRYPMRRLGERGSGQFERISWEEAVSLIADNIQRTGREYGPGSRFVLYGTGVCGIMRPGTLMNRLLALDGGYLNAYNSYSSACVTYISDYVYGTPNGGSSASTQLDAKLMILWAANTAETIFGPERNYYLSQLKQKGVKIVAVDPRLSQTGVTYADDWFALRPSTDAALADAMAYVIFEEGLQDQHFIDTYCIGFDEDHMPEGVPAGESYHSYLFGVKDGVRKTPEWAEAITGIEAHRIRALAREYATTKPACIEAGFGAQRHGNGEQSARALMMLACLTGNVGVSGGSNGANGSMINEHMPMANYLNRTPNPYPGKIPTFLWTKAIEHGTELEPLKDGIKGVERLDSNIKMLFCMASDILINQHSNINDTIRILKDDQKCEMIVCSDVFMTPSARYADLVLPATSVFEGENMINPWAGSNYYLKHNRVIRPLFGCRFEWDWLKEVAEKMGLYDEFIEGKPEVGDWLKANYAFIREKEPELPDYETFSREGGWQFKDQVKAVGFEQEIKDPANHPFPTPSGKIEIFSKRLYDLHQPDMAAIPRYMPCPEGPEDPLREKFPLQLIGWHTRRRAHSIHDNNEWQDEVEKPGVWIHPDDAAARGIRDGEMTEVFNDRGRIRIPAVVTRRIRPGVAAISQGGWFTPDGQGTDVRGSINVLTSTAYPTPIAKGNPQHTNLVEISKV
ncbi:MAG: molybdopterin-dependent oxidoreductase [Firmicutes bacterium]|nr:molybdopterin-dependent oxidoreductase [Bacillota bacterium]